MDRWPRRAVSRARLFGVPAARLNSRPNFRTRSHQPFVSMPSRTTRRSVRLDGFENKPLENPQLQAAEMTICQRLQGTGGIRSCGFPQLRPLDDSSSTTYHRPAWRGGLEILWPDRRVLAIPPSYSIPTPIGNQ